MIIHEEGKLVQTKIVYFGPAMSGKTTSLRSLFKHIKNDKELHSIETTTGRTLFFDFGTIDFKGLEWTVKIYLYSTTGQDFYQSTRPATMYGVDGIIFIVDSQRSLLAYNQNSWNELKRFFNGRFQEMPVVICLNKYDLEDRMTVEEIQQAFNIGDDEHIQIIPSVATEGRGVKEAFCTIMGQIFPNFHLTVG